MVELLAERGVQSATVLKIGGGVGEIQCRGKLSR